MSYTRLERCQIIMSWIHNNQHRMRRIQDISAETNIPLASVSRSINFDFPDCFVKTPRWGPSLTGKWPAGIPFDLETGKPIKPERPISVDPFEWDQDVLKELNAIWKSRYEMTVLQTLQQADKTDAELIRSLGRHLSEMAERLLESGVIDTSNQLEWRPSE